MKTHIRLTPAPRPSNLFVTAVKMAAGILLALLAVKASATENDSGFFINLSETYGIPVGLDAVPKSEAAARSATYKIEKTPGKAVIVSLVNGSGTPIPDLNAPFRAARREYQLRPDGTLESIHFFSETGSPLGRHIHSPPHPSPRGGSEVLVEIRKPSVLARPDLKWTNESPASERHGEGPGIAAYRVFFDQSGRERSRLFLNAAHGPQPDSQGVLGYGRIYDEAGRLVQKTMLDHHGAIRRDRRGIESVRWERDTRGNITVVSFHAAGGRPVHGHDGWHITQIEVDAAGNPVSESRFDTNRQPTWSDEKESFKEVVQFDARGNPIEKRIFDWNGEPEETGRVVMKYDPQGRLVEESHFTASGDSVEKKTYKLDPRGKRIETVSQKFPGDPVKELSGFDAAGFLVQASHFDGKGNPRIIFGNASQVFIKRNEAGQEIEISFLDGNGNPAVGDRGYSRMAIQYNEHGHIARMEFSGVDGKPIPPGSGYAKALTRMDEEGRTLETAYLDADGQPVLSGDGCAKWTAKYDERGHQIETSYFGTDGQPIESKEGFRCRFVVDGFGNILEKVHLDANGNPMVSSPCKAARHVYRYDEFGNKIEETSYDIGGNPTTHKEFYRVLSEFDDLGDKRMEHSFRADGSSLKSIYGPNGEAETIHLGPDGNPSDEHVLHCRVVQRPAGPHGEAMTEYHLLDGRYELSHGDSGSEFFDAEERPISRTLKNAKGLDRETLHFLRNGCRRISYFDRRERLLEQRFVDADGTTVQGPEGFAIQRWEYDSRPGQDILLKTSFHDSKGAPVQGPQGFASQAWTVNDYGLETETTYFDADGEKTPGPEKFATRTTTRLDGWGPVLETAVFDPAGRPVEDSNGVWKTVHTLDEKGRPTRIATLGIDGRAASVGGIAVREISYDDNGTWRRETFQGDDGRPAALGGKCHRVETRFDEYGNPTQTLFYGSDGSPVLHPDGFASQHRSYGTDSQLLEIAHFGLQNEPVARADGYHKEILRRDRMGNILERDFFDTKDQAVLTSGGFSKIQRVLDESNRLVEEVYLDLEGHPVPTPRNPAPTGRDFAALDPDLDRIENFQSK